MLIRYDILRLTLGQRHSHLHPSLRGGGSLLFGLFESVVPDRPVLLVVCSLAGFGSDYITAAGVETSVGNFGGPFQFTSSRSIAQHRTSNRRPTATAACFRRVF